MNPYDDTDPFDEIVSQFNDDAFPIIPDDEHVDWDGRLQVMEALQMANAALMADLVEAANDDDKSYQRLNQFYEGLTAIHGLLASYLAELFGDLSTMEVGEEVDEEERVEEMLLNRMEAAARGMRSPAAFFEMIPTEALVRAVGFDPFEKYRI